MAEKGTRLRWIGVGAQPAIEGIQSTTVDPDTQLPSEAAPEWLCSDLQRPGYGSTRADDGICLLHDRYLGAHSTCADFSANAVSQLSNP